MPLDRRQFIHCAAASSAVASFAWPHFLHAADTPATTWRGEIADDPQSPERAPNALGRSGAVVIRSKAHFEWFMAELQAAGYLLPAGKPTLQCDFAKQSLAVVLHYGDEGDKFVVRSEETKEKRVALDIAMSYIIYKSRGKVVNKFQFFAVPIAKREELALSISTYHPHNGGMYPSLEKAHLEWTHTFTTEGGDVVDGLTAKLRPEVTTIKRGDDIRCEFQLQYHAVAKEKNGVYAQAAPSVFVWDGKYSNGYRNHSFLVEFPDGASKIFQPEEKEFAKNIPHPVEVSEQKPYVLPEWFEGKTFKSLKQLGLETKLPGRYVVTGLYAEKGEIAETFKRDKVRMWGGRIASAPVAFEVT